MNDAQELVWLPASLGSAMGEHLRRLLSDMASTWSLPAPGEVQATLLRADGAVPEGDEPDGSLDLMARDPGALRGWLAEQLMGAAWMESAIVDRTMRQLLHGLRDGLLASFGAAPASPEGPPDRARPGHRGVRLQVRWAGRAMHLRLGTAQLRASGWLKPAPQTRLAPVNLASALAATPVPLLATLGKIELQLSDWLHLAPGDVLLLDKPLAEPLTVQVPGSDWRQQAQLGANADLTHRTLRWVSP